MGTTQEKFTWQQLVEMKEGTIVDDWFDEGVRCIIIRGPGALCAYIGIPLDHPLAGFDYDSIPVPAHGGLTYAGQGDGYRPKNFYWYGMDYAHSGDYCFYYDQPPLMGKFTRENSKKWLPEMVKQDLWETIYDFKKLMQLAETIVSRTKQLQSL